MRPFEKNWRALPVLLLGLFVAATGCSKKTSASTPVPPPVADDQTAAGASQPVSPQPTHQPTVTAVQADGQPDLGALNHAMIRWLNGHRRVPANFAEFAASADVIIPPPPPGKKYLLAKNMHVLLVDQ